MTPRDTRTGGVLESMVLPALTRGGYEYETQKTVGERPGGGRHRVDVVATKDEKKILVSLKWQQVGGTAEQKVPFEVISLIVGVKEHGYDMAYLVLGGDGWSLREFFTNGELQNFIDYDGVVEILTLERFVAKANTGGL